MRASTTIATDSFSIPSRAAPGLIGFAACLLAVLGCGSSSKIPESTTARVDARTAGGADEATSGAARGEFGLGFILLRDRSHVDEAKLSEQGRRFGLGAARRSETEGASEDVRAYSFDSGLEVLVALMPPHPDAGGMLRGILSPESEEAAASPGHLIVTVLSLQGSAVERDAVTARAVAAVAASAHALAAMLGHGIMFYRAEIFDDIVSSAEPGALPLEVCVDVTIAGEDDGRASLLTHGLVRYAKEEVYVTADRASLEDAFEFTLNIARWFVGEPGLHIPTGDTVGRSDTERIPVQRVASPLGDGSQVMRLDL